MAIEYFKQCIIPGSVANDDIDAFLKWLSNYNRSDSNFYKVAFQNLQQNHLSFLSYYLELRNLYFKYKCKSKTDSLTQNEREELCRLYQKLCDQKSKRRISVS